MYHDSREDFGTGVRRERAQNTQPKPMQSFERTPLTPPKPLGAVDEYGIPDDPFHPPAETQRPRRSRAARNAQAPDEAAVQPSEPVQPAQPPKPVQPQFARPASPEIPEWLKVAQQNNAPMPSRVESPRVHAASGMAQTYASAGYPKELLDEQREADFRQAAMAPQRRRHGAQYAVKPTYEPQPIQRPAPRPVQPMQPPPQSVSPTQEAMMSRAYHQPRRAELEPYEVEDDEVDERALPGVRIPWLAIAAFLAVLAAVILWIMQNTYTRQTQQVLDQRAAQEAQILENHPLRYREIISDKANKYNLHPAFVSAIILNESSFRPDATSNVDARGLMQLMDDTAGWIYEKLDDPSRPYSFDDLYDPEINAEYGCWYLNYLSELFYGDPILVAAAFHAGQGEVRNWLNDSTYSKDGRSIRLEDMIDGPTKRYVTRVLSDFAAYKRLYFGG